ncbi:MAG: DNA mismatch repair protein MutS [Spirochaetes bacterium]|nr:DNA mismatch repair protein MutS [Spirochaetota bacterium]
MSAENKVTPMMRQFHELKREHPDKILFFRCGDFYEMFYDDAVEASRIMQITLTRRAETPMCGVPYHAMQNYLSRLLAAGKKVAIIEQVKEAESKGLFRREVTQIATPGTITEWQQLDQARHNHIASWAPGEAGGAFAFLDLSTGELDVFPMALSGGGGALDAEGLLSRYEPREWIVPEEAPGPPPRIQTLVTALPNWHFHGEYARRKLMEFYKLASLTPLGLADRDADAAAAWVLLQYAQETQMAALSHIRPPRLHLPGQTLWVDAVTQRNLELVKNHWDGGENHTLYSCLKATQTAMGTRFLKQAILEPPSSLDEIARRHDQVAWFTARPAFLESTRSVLANVGDFERLCARIATGRVLPRELRTFSGALGHALDLLGLLAREPGNPFAWDGEEEIRSLLGECSNTLLDEPANDLLEGGYIRPEVHRDLARYAKAKAEGQKWIVDLWESEKDAHQLPNLKVKFNEVSGWFFELPKAQARQAPAHFVRKQTLVSGERFTTEKLLALEVELREAAENNNALEKKIFAALIEKLRLGIPRIQALARHCAWIDFMASFAHTALSRRWVRPAMAEGGDLIIKGGRHPVLETLTEAPFVPNDCRFGEGHGRILLVTGPNMSGKSTFLRQNALVVHLAHLGSFVPAEEAVLPLTDRIFTRIGAADHLARGQSTFMVEMTETAQILGQATNRSLVILDEIGRGTSTYDGLSLAWAIVEYLADEVPARTLFATHYHELTQLADRLALVRNFHPKVKKEGGTLVFLKKVEAGPADDSYGIAVGELAGLPARVIERAKAILGELEAGETHHEKGKRVAQGASQGKKPPAPGNPPSPILEALAALDLTRTTPMEALALLDDWKRKLGR